jgi:HD-GYP domain-containing protein (c-di-GMP phosphodiesterase class II)
MEARDPYTCSHQKRVAELSTKIATIMKISPDKISNLNRAARAHDIG